MTQATYDEIVKIHINYYILLQIVGKEQYFGQTLSLLEGEKIDPLVLNFIKKYITPLQATCDHYYPNGDKAVMAKLISVIDFSSGLFCRICSHQFPDGRFDGFHYENIPR